MLDQQPNQQTDASQPQPKLIDGVNPTPKLSGENQKNHLQEDPDNPSMQPTQQQAVDNVKPVPQTTQQPQDVPGDDAQQSSQVQEDTQPDHTETSSGKKPSQNNFPYVAVILAVITGSCLIGLTVYLQIQSS